MIRPGDQRAHRPGGEEKVGEEGAEPEAEAPEVEAEEPDGEQRHRKDADQQAG